MPTAVTEQRLDTGLVLVRDGESAVFPDRVGLQKDGVEVGLAEVRLPGGTYERVRGAPKGVTDDLDITTDLSEFEGVLRGVCRDEQRERLRDSRRDLQRRRAGVKNTASPSVSSLTARGNGALAARGLYARPGMRAVTRVRYRERAAVEPFYILVLGEQREVTSDRRAGGAELLGQFLDRDAVRLVDLPDDLRPPFLR